MIRCVRVFGLCAIVCIMASCASSSIETNKDPANLKVLQKVFVLVNTGDVKILYSSSADSQSKSNAKESLPPKDTTFGGYLLDSFERNLTQRSIETKGVRIGGLELGEESIQKDIDDFGATIMLTVELSDGTVTQTNFLYSGSILVSIIDTELKNKTVWRAKLRVQALTGWGVPTGSIDDLIKKAFEQMTADGLLKPVEKPSGT